MKQPGILVAIGLVIAVATVAMADTNITESVLLAANADWSDRGKVILHHGVTLDLNGHSLKVADFGATSFAHVTNETGVVAGYKDLEFIEATGTQHIITDLIPESTDRFEMKMCVNKLDVTQSFFCSRASASSKRMELLFYHSKLCVYFNNNQVKAYTGAFSSTGEILDVYVDFSSGKFAVTNSTGVAMLMEDSTFSPAAFDGGAYLMFFKNNTSVSGNVPSGTIGNAAYGRIYCLKVYDKDGNLKWYFSPAARASDGAIGLYERVNGKFYGATAGTFNDDAETEITNSASGDPAEFTVSVPAGYRALEYIEATGAQRVETDYTPNSNDCVKTRIEFTDLCNQLILCARTSTTADMFCLAYVNGLRFDYNTSKKTASSISKDTPYDIVMNDWVTPGKCTYNSTLVTTFTQANFTPPATATLFASYTYNNGSKGYWSNYAMCKFYSLSIYNKDGVLQRNYVPAYGEAEKAAGLYETETGRFYQSATATGFTSYGEMADNITPVPTNTSVKITGNLKLVKEGSGTFVVSSTMNTYSGGTLVKEGTLVAGGVWDMGIFGADGSEVVVSETNGIPAALDFNGYMGGPNCMIVLDGGILMNSGPAVSANTTGIVNMRLEEDSTLSFAKVYPLAYKDGLCTVDLGGKTLYVNSSTNTYFRNVVATNGTITATGTGNLYFSTTSSDLREATLCIAADAHLKVDIGGTMLGNYIVDATSGTSGSTTNVAVYGTFKPNTDYFIGCEIQDGATIDCSGRTTPLPIVGSNTSAKSKAISFAPGATVGVRIGGRKKLQATPLITWTASEKPDPSVKFVRADADRKYSLVVKDDGLYYVGPGLIISFF